VSVNPPTGELGFKASAAVRVTVDSTSLREGETRGEIVFDAPGAGQSPLAVTVVVTVTAPMVSDERPPGRTPRPPVDEPRPPDDLGAATKGRMGVRAGYADLTIGGDEVAEGAPLFGFFYGGGRQGKVGYEVGLDVSRSSSLSGAFTSTLLAGRFDLLFSMGKPDASARVYLVSGLSGLADLTQDVNTSSTGTAAAVNLGAGAGFGKGRFDVRATYSLLIGSENSFGMTLLSAGLAF
jgi:hypothetical protein